jgi:hypothetical protein
MQRAKRGARAAARHNGAMYLPRLAHTDGDVGLLAAPLHREWDVISDVPKSPEGLEQGHGGLQ